MSDPTDNGAELGGLSEGTSSSSGTPLSNSPPAPPSRENAQGGISHSELSGIPEAAGEEVFELNEYAQRRNSIPEGAISQQSQTIDPQLLAELRAEAKANLFFFCKAILGMKDLVLHVHGEMCLLLQDQSKAKVKITLPRSHLKSSIGSIGFPIWSAVNDPNIRILIAQNTYGNATKKLNEIRSHFESNEMFKLLFPELLPKKNQTWKTDSLCVPRTINAPESTFEAAGVKTAVVSRHYDIIIEDDTVAPDFDELGMENLAPTKEDIDLAIGWHRLVAPLFVNPKESRNIVIGTRWFERDLLSWIDENEKYFVSYSRTARENGKPIWPERFDDEVLQQLEHSMGPYLFSCLYMNNPLSSSDQVFQLQWINYYDKEDQDIIVTTTVDPGGDPSVAKSKDIDYNAVVTTGKSTSTGRVFVLEVTRERLNSSQLIDKIFEHVRKWKPVMVGIEAQGYQHQLLHWIEEKRRALNQPIVVKPITNNKRSKEARIRGLQPLFAAGMVFFRRHQQPIVSELLAFPRGAHDDMIDALSMQLPMWQNTRVSPRAKRELVYDPLSVEVAMNEVEEKLAERAKLRNPVFDLLRPEVYELSA